MKNFSTCLKFIHHKNTAYIKGVVDIITLLAQKLNTFYAPKILSAFTLIVLESLYFQIYLSFGTQLAM